VPEALEVAEMLPQAVPEQPAPVKVQVTPWVLFVTVAVMVCVPLATTFAVVGDTVTPTTGAAVTVIVELALLVGSVTEVAVSVTVAGLGTLAGAVYVMATPEALELAESPPQVAPEHPEPERAHVTPWVLFTTVAVNCCVPLTATEAVGGVVDTATAVLGGPPMKAEENKAYPALCCVQVGL
jgi:hypothetical protein